MPSGTLPMAGGLFPAVTGARGPGDHDGGRAVAECTPEGVPGEGTPPCMYTTRVPGQGTRLGLDSVTPRLGLDWYWPRLGLDSSSRPLRGQ